MMTMTPLNEIAAKLREWEKITLVSHRAPDGDTLGSAVASGGPHCRLRGQTDCHCRRGRPTAFGRYLNAIGGAGIHRD